MYLWSVIGHIHTSSCKDRQWQIGNRQGPWESWKRQSIRDVRSWKVSFPQTKKKSKNGKYISKYLSVIRLKRKNNCVRVRESKIRGKRNRWLFNSTPPPIIHGVSWSKTISNIKSRRLKIHTYTHLSASTYLIFPRDRGRRTFFFPSTLAFPVVKYSQLIRRDGASVPCKHYFTPLSCFIQSLAWERCHMFESAMNRGGNILFPKKSFHFFNN